MTLTDQAPQELRPLSTPDQATQETTGPDNDLAKASGRLVDSVGLGTGEKWANSPFFQLMRDFHNGKLRNEEQPDFHGLESGARPSHARDKTGLPSADRNNKATLLLTVPFLHGKVVCKGLGPARVKISSRDPEREKVQHISSDSTTRKPIANGEESGGATRSPPNCHAQTLQKLDPMSSISSEDSICPFPRYVDPFTGGTSFGVVPEWWLYVTRECTDGVLGGNAAHGVKSAACLEPKIRRALYAFNCGQLGCCGG